MGTVTTYATRGARPALMIAATVTSLFVAGSVQAASQAPASAVPLSDLIEVDTLGYTCIAEASLETAFGATGKSGRLPRTCLPEPCEGAISRAELATLIGRTPSRDEWDDYVSRYAQVCRHEALGFGSPGETIASDSPGAFWAPFLAPRLASATLQGGAPVRNSAPANSVAPPPFMPVLSSRSSGDASDEDGDTGDGPVARVPSGRNGGEGEEEPPLPPLADGASDDEVVPAVPLPGGLALMGGALMALGVAGRRRPRRNA